LDAAIRFENVSKRYFLGSRRAYLRHYLLPTRADVPDGADVLWALKDVSFEAQAGETLGLIGPNGAGKTTALSLLAGIVSPTTGEIWVRGRIGALIKLGAGFHPDLTGRENVFLNGAILGLHPTEISRLYDDIVSFAEMGQFMETPVKRYSSGMYVRLAFSVAVHSRPDVLLVDEVLSVGDVSFQSRCFNKIGEIREAGATILFVSHNMHHIASFCDRVIYLDHGQIQKLGDAQTVLASYMEDAARRISGDSAEDGSDLTQVNGTGKVRITGVSFHDADGNAIEEIQTGEPLIVRVAYRSSEEVRDSVLDVVMRDAARGNLFQATNRDFGFEFGSLSGTGHIEIAFPAIVSNNQVLSFFLTFWNSNHTEQYDWKRHMKLMVKGNPASSGRLLYDCTWAHVSHDPVAADGRPTSTPALVTREAEINV
jgi:ABC-type polysaccharide/polyol phosphate transport system ATPase subunit